MSRIVTQSKLNELTGKNIDYGKGGGYCPHYQTIVSLWGSVVASSNYQPNQLVKEEDIVVDKDLFLINAETGSLYFAGGGTYAQIPAIDGHEDFIYIAGGGEAIGALSMLGGLYVVNQSTKQWELKYKDTVRAYGYAHLARFSTGWVFYKGAGEKGALVGGFVGGMVNPKFGMRFNKKNGFRGDAASARNATTTPRFNISKESLPDYAKPNWQGDELALTKERLANGGFDRLEQFSKYSGEKAEQFRNATGMGYRDFYPFENDFGKTYRQYLLDSKPAKGTRADFKVNKEVAVFSDRTQNVYTTILDDVPDRFKNPRYRTTTEAHEFAHFAFNPQRRPPLDVYNPPLTNPHREYLLGLKDRNEYGTELTARGTQIKNYFGLDKDKPITEDMLKYAADNYVKDKGFDNNMTDFFSGIKNYKEMAKWLSELSPMLALPLLNY